MDKTQVTQALKELRANSPKRNFNQSVEITITLKDFDIKKDPVNIFAALAHTKGKKVSVCALVGPELLSQAKEVCDEAISVDEFPKYQDKKISKQLAGKHDFFIAQATIMPKIASAFGRVFGPKGKMPNPKAGCVVPPNANLKPLYEKLQKTVKFQTKADAMLQGAVASEQSPDDEIIDNILAAYNEVSHALPKHELNIQGTMIKFTMSPTITIGSKQTKKGSEKAPKEKPKAKEAKPKKKKGEKGKPKTSQKEDPKQEAKAEEKPAESPKKEEVKK